MQGYTVNIARVSEGNKNFRQILYTGKHLQLVVMSLLSNEEIGLETHEATDQFFRLEKGTLKFIVNGEETVIEEEGVFIVPAGSAHNVVNVGAEPAKLYTIYAPPNHPDGTVHATRADAMAGEHH